jgi:hypothetical protein
MLKIRIQKLLVIGILTFALFVGVTAFILGGKSLAGDDMMGARLFIIFFCIVSTGSAIGIASVYVKE